MSLTNTVAAKFFGAFVAVAMLFTLVAPANAQTTEELQQMINDLLAQVAALQGGGDSMGSSSSVCPYAWTRTLNIGASGADVMTLQKFLNSDADTRIAASGVGSAGMETDYYGGLTGAAVAKFQEKYRTDILSPLGLVNPTTFFGNSTMAKANALCASAPVMDDTMDDADDTMDDSDDADDSDDSDGPLNGGEADIDTVSNAKSGDDTDLEEGQTDAPVMDVEFDVDDGDIKIKRIDVGVDPDASNDEEEPWDVFEEISIWVDGDKVAEQNADDEDDWEEDEPSTGDFKLRFSGVDIIVREGDEANFTVGVTLQGSIDGTSDGETWDFFIPTSGIRAVDGEGIDLYSGATGDTVSVDIDSEGNDDELKVQKSSDDPDETTIAVDTDSKTGFTTIFAFDLDTDDSVNDITIDGLYVNVVVPGSTFNAVVDDAQLLVNGDVYDDWSFLSGITGTDATTTLDFDTKDEDFMIDAGDEVTVEFQVEFNQLSGNYSEGQTIFASSTEVGMDAEGADNLTVGSQVTGSAGGDTHTLRSEGLIVEPGTHDFETTGTNDDTGTFTIEFDVTAFENDFYIAKNATSTGVNTDGGVDYSVSGPGTITQSGALSSTADEDTVDVFTVSEGDTETFTLTVTVQSTSAGLFTVNLNDIWFSTNTNGVSSVETDPANPVTDYRVVDKQINT